MSKTKTNKLLIIFIVFALFLAGVVGATYYYGFKDRIVEDRPPQLNMKGIYQAFLKDGPQGFLKYEESDKDLFELNYGDPDEEHILLQEGINYVYVNEELEIEDVIECIDPVAERILIAQYKPQFKKFFTFPKGPFGNETEQFASVHQKFAANDGVVIISRREAKAYCLKSPEQQGEELAAEPAFGGWNLVAANDKNIQNFVQDFDERVQSLWEMEDRTKFRKVDDLNNDLESYYLVWLKLESQACIPSKEPHLVLKGYSSAIGNRDLGQMFEELPPGYQKVLNDLVNTEFKEILDNAKIDEIAPKISTALKTLAEGINADFDAAFSMLPVEIRNMFPAAKMEKAREVVVSTVNLAAAWINLIAKVAGQDEINIKSILSNDVKNLLGQAEMIADQIASNDLNPELKEIYQEYLKYIDFFKNLDAETKEITAEVGTVTVKYSLNNLPEEFADLPEKEDASMIRVMEDDGSCYWVPEGLPDVLDEVEQEIRPTLKTVADEINDNFTIGKKSQAIAAIDDWTQAVTDFKNDGKACTLIGESLNLYGDIFNIIADEEVSVEIENIDMVKNSTLVIPKPENVDSWDYVAGPVNGSYQDAAGPVGAKNYTPNPDYLGEDWIMHTAGGPGNNEKAIVYCFNVNPM